MTRPCNLCNGTKEPVQFSVEWGYTCDGCYDVLEAKWEMEQRAAPSALSRDAQAFDTGATPGTPVDDFLQKVTSDVVEGES